MIAANVIRQALRCDNTSCVCHKPTGHVHCPAHDPARQDKTPSLSLTQKDKLLFHCFNGCLQEAVIDAMKKKGIWPQDNENNFKKERGNKSVGKGRNSATPPGLTIEELAKTKGFQTDGPTGLKAWGVEQAVQRGATVIRIPYMNQAGEVVAVRCRHSLKGPKRFTWRKGDKVLLYGLWRLREIQEAGWVLLVEGETDFWTCCLYGIPALGLPGKSTWKPVWAELLKGLRVYLWQEPDAPELPAKIGKDLPGLMVMPAPDGFKDLNEAHVQGEDIPALVERLKAQAIPAANIIKKQADKRLAELKEAARPVLAAADPLQEVRRALVNMGFGGDLTPALITYLAATSRLLAMRHGAMPVHLLLLGQASSGKSYVLHLVLCLFPEEAYHTIPAGSPRVLIYDDAELRHRAVIFGEADSLPAGEDNPAASAIRNLLQDHYLHYDVTVKDPITGCYVVKKVQKPGPTVLLTTSTRRLGYQLDTRVFSLDVGDSREKIKAALEAQADMEMNAPALPNEALAASQGYLQAQAPWNVVVPFVKPLADIIAQKATAPRILRDFARLLSLVKSVAVLRQARRQWDSKGRLIAILEDYATVYELVGPMYEATLTGATKEMRETVQAVEEMLSLEQNVTATNLAARLGINRGTASRRVRTAIGRGWLVNRETKRGQPWDLGLGEPMPGQEGLPTPEELLHHQNFDAIPGATPQHFESIADVDGCCTVAGATDGFYPNADNDDQEHLKEVVI